VTWPWVVLIVAVSVVALALVVARVIETPDDDELDEDGNWKRWRR
jgi:hypothetical protein